jgi:hypothetical protein
MLSNMLQNISVAFEEQARRVPVSSVQVLGWCSRSTDSAATSRVKRGAYLTAAVRMLISKCR